MANERSRGGRGAQGAPDRSTKAEKKEQARQEREEIRRRMAKRRHTRTAGLIAGLVAAAVVVVLVIAMGGGGKDDGGDTTPGGGLAGLMTDPGPWPANNAQLSDRLAQLGFPAFADNPGHHHARLWLYVSGDPETVPADIGFDEAGGSFSPLHTHDTTGTIHVEAADASWKATLGNLFDAWGLRLSSTCLGGNCAAGELTLRAFVNGEPWDGSPRDVPLDDQNAIVLVFGTDTQTPDPIPDAFTFTGA